MLELELIGSLLLSIILGGLVGIEREKSHKPAGFRTHMLVCLGSCLVTIISLNYFKTDPVRVASGIVTGIGFLGAGTIIASKGDVRGLTTAASLWTVSAIGMGVGVKAYFLAIFTGILVFLILSLGKIDDS